MPPNRFYSLQSVLFHLWPHSSVPHSPHFTNRQESLYFLQNRASSLLNRCKAAYPFSVQAFPLSRRREGQWDAAAHPPLLFTTGHPQCPNTAPAAPLVRTSCSPDPTGSFINKWGSISFNVPTGANYYYLEHAKLFMYLTENQKVTSPIRREKIKNHWSTGLQVHDSFDSQVS